MEHAMDEAEKEILENTDFIIPLKSVGVISRTVLEAIHLFYAPRRIVVVAPRAEVDMLRLLSRSWAVGSLDMIAEEDFFRPHLNLSLSDILHYYGEAKSVTPGAEVRESGWWLQQLIKIGASTQVPNISPVYVVWDADLVPIRRWRLCSREGPGRVVTYYTAVLQQAPRSEFNAAQYAACMQALCNLSPRCPEGGGTFVSHHMCFYTSHVAGLLERARKVTGSDLPWPQLFMSFSQQFYRFSEYKTYASYCLWRQENEHTIENTAVMSPPDLNIVEPEFKYHPLKDFGADGVRYRQADDVLREMIPFCGVKDGGIPYLKAREFVKVKWASDNDAMLPGYLQLDHVYGLDRYYNS